MFRHRLLGEGGDHVHCTVEPSPGHIRSRHFSRLATLSERHLDFHLLSVSGDCRAGWGLPRKGVGVEKFAPSLESLFSLGFEGGSLGYPRNFAGMCRTSGGTQKVCAKNILCSGKGVFSEKSIF